MQFGKLTPEILVNQYLKNNQKEIDFNNTLKDQIQEITAEVFQNHSKDKAQNLKQFIKYSKLDRDFTKNLMNLSYLAYLMAQLQLTFDFTVNDFIQLLKEAKSCTRIQALLDIIDKNFNKFSEIVDIIKEIGDRILEEDLLKFSDNPFIKLNIYKYMPLFNSQNMDYQDTCDVVTICSDLTYLFNDQGKIKRQDKILISVFDSVFKENKNYKPEDTELKIQEEPVRGTSYFNSRVTADAFAYNIYMASSSKKFKLLQPKLTFKDVQSAYPIFGSVQDLNKVDRWNPNNDGSLEDVYLPVSYGSNMRISYIFKKHIDRITFKRDDDGYTILNNKSSTGDDCINGDKKLWCQKYLIGNFYAGDYTSCLTDDLMMHYPMSRKKNINMKTRYIETITFKNISLDDVEFIIIVETPSKEYVEKIVTLLKFKLKYSLTFGLIFSHFKQYSEYKDNQKFTNYFKKYSEYLNHGEILQDCDVIKTAFK